MKCPTCPDATENHCRSCGAEVPADTELAPSPFALEVHGDDELHLQCDGCLDESAANV